VRVFLMGVQERNEPTRWRRSRIKSTVAPVDFTARDEVWLYWREVVRPQS